MKYLILSIAVAGLCSCKEEDKPRGTKEQVEELKKESEEMSESFQKEPPKIR